MGGGGERVLSQLHKVCVPGLHGNAQMCSVRSVGRGRGHSAAGEGAGQGAV